MYSTQPVRLLAIFSSPFPQLHSWISIAKTISAQSHKWLICFFYLLPRVIDNTSHNKVAIPQEDF